MRLSKTVSGTDFYQGGHPAGLPLAQAKDSFLILFKKPKRVAICTSVASARSLVKTQARSDCHLRGFRWFLVSGVLLTSE
jgi:hypothetical protein